MRSVPPCWGAGMRWAVWLLVGAGAMAACGGDRAGDSNPDGGPGSAVIVPDAGGDAGVASDCKGLVPATVGPGYAFDVTPATPNDSCTLATSDGQGVVAAQNGASSWAEYTASGLKYGNFDPASLPVLPQTNGFVSLYGAPM